MANRIERIFRIYNRLKRGPVTIEILKKWAKDVGIVISERQLYRDLDTITNYLQFEKESLVIIEGEKNKKLWKLEFAKTSENISVWDINSYYLLKYFAPDTISSARSESFIKIESLIYQSFSKSKFEINNTANNLLFDSTHFFEYSHTKEEHLILEDIIWAIQNQRKIIISKNNHESTCLQRRYVFPLKVNPLYLIMHRGAIYVSFFEESHKEYFILALYQLTKIDLLNDRFDRKKLETGYIKYRKSIFGVTGNVDDNVYKIKIETTKEIGESFLLYKTHPSQKITFTTKGTAIINLTCGINRELLGFIAMWFDHMKIISPIKLKKMFIQKQKETLQIHKSSTLIIENNKLFIRNKF